MVNNSMKFLGNLKDQSSKLAQSLEEKTVRNLKKFASMAGTVDEHQQQERMNICLDCEHLFKPTSSCRKCGCFMRAKTWLADQECPVGKWGAIELVDVTDHDAAQ